VTSRAPFLLRPLGPGPSRDCSLGCRPPTSCFCPLASSEGPSNSETVSFHGAGLQCLVLTCHTQPGLGTTHQRRHTLSGSPSLWPPTCKLSRQCPLLFLLGVCQHLRGQRKTHLGTVGPPLSAPQVSRHEEKPVEIGLIRRWVGGR
jgi:hypothetical protein